MTRKKSTAATTYSVTRSNREIDNQLNRGAAWEDAGGSSVRGMTYESGVKAAIEWLMGDRDDVPIECWPEEDDD